MILEFRGEVQTPNTDFGVTDIKINDQTRSPSNEESSKPWSTVKYRGQGNEKKEAKGSVKEQPVR